MIKQMDPTTTGNASMWRARLRNLGLAATVALVFSPLALPVADPVAVQAQPVPDPCDFTTSGGYVITDAGKKANFGVHGGCKKGEFWGHLNYVDHATGYHVNSVEVTAYIAPFGVTSPVRDVCGIANTNNPADGDQVFFRARLMDNGEPGGLDQFGLKLSKADGYGGFAQIYQVSPRALGTARPGAGNVQLHDANASTMLPAVLDEYAACGGLSFGTRSE